MYHKLSRVKIFLYRQCLRTFGSSNYFEAKSNISVKIPKRIERSPIDILKALAKTVQADPSSQHYKFPDDPYFMANTNKHKMVNALSIESGRKSARFIVNSHPEFFQGKIGEPEIKDFYPQLEYNEDSIIDENTLINFIINRNVEDAQKVYDALKNKKIDVSLSTKQMLLELVCFYNCADKQNEKDLESKWYQKNDDKVTLRTWSDKNFAEKLFEDMNPNCPLAYSALIQGMLKFGQIDKAIELYKLAKDKNLSLSVHVYNGILLNVLNVKETRRWEYILETLEEMKLKKLKPNLDTMNAVLHCLDKIPRLPNKMKLAMQTVAEFRKLEIEPSLGSYFYLINIRCAERTHRKELLSFIQKILKEIDGKVLEIEHDSDMLFFPGIMKHCASALKNSECAHLIHNILKKEDNVKFIAGNIDEELYYGEYLHVIFSMDPIESAMALYENLVPNYYTPNIRTNKKILITIDMNEAYDFLPMVWNNVKSQTDLTVRAAVPLILDMVIRYKGQNESVTKIFLDNANYVLNEVKNTKKKQTGLNDNTISNAIIAFLKFGDINDALIMVQMVFDSNSLYTLSHEALIIFYEICLAKEFSHLILNCLKHGELSNHPNLAEMAKKALPLLSTLDEINQKWIINLTKTKEMEPSEQKTETVP